MTDHTTEHLTSDAMCDGPSEFYGQKKTAEVLGVTLETLRYWRDTDFGPYWEKIAGRFVYLAVDVQAWCD